MLTKDELAKIVTEENRLMPDLGGTMADIAHDEAAKVRALLGLLRQVAKAERLWVYDYAGAQVQCRACERYADTSDSVPHGANCPVPLLEVLRRDLPTNPDPPAALPGAYVTVKFST